MINVVVETTGRWILCHFNTSEILRLAAQGVGGGQAFQQFFSLIALEGDFRKAKVPAVEMKRIFREAGRIMHVDWSPTPALEQDMRKWFRSLPTLPDTEWVHNPENLYWSRVHHGVSITMRPSIDRTGKIREDKFMVSMSLRGARICDNQPVLASLDEAKDLVMATAVSARKEE